MTLLQKDNDVIEKSPDKIWQLVLNLKLVITNYIQAKFENLTSYQSSLIFQVEELIHLSSNLGENGNLKFLEEIGLMCTQKPPYLTVLGW